MGERAHPDDPGFQSPWRFRWRKGLIPWISYGYKPYRSAFLWRYGWVSQYCRNCDVLDVPCGMGWGTSLLRGCRSAWGVDLSEEAIQEAKSRYGDRVNYKTGNMAELEFPDKSLDVVCCLEGIEHVPVEVGRRFLGEAHRVLRPGGALFLSSPHCRTAPHSGNPFHIHEYQPEEIRREIEYGFSIQEVVTREVEALTVHYFRSQRKEVPVDALVS